MRIRKLQLKNIGVFDLEEIEFKPSKSNDKAEIHILTGANGSGKSTILIALAGAFDHFQFDTPQHPSNNLHKRFRYFDYFDGEKSSANCKSGFTVSFDDKERVEVVGDPRTNYAHTYKTIEKVKAYRNIIISSAKPTVALDYAVFAYSGYRHIESNEIVSIGTSSNTNPFLDSLEFVKHKNQSNGLTINNWIADSISKSAVEKERNPEKSKKFASAVKSLESTIAEITGWKVEFDLRTDPFDLRLKLNNQDLDFDVLPDGLRSLISWIGDLLMRVDSLKWNDELPAFEKNLILFLDEIEVHLHPEWQRKVLPVVQKLFKNSQIFLSTHSPFVVNSVDGAWVYKLGLENGKAKLESVIESRTTESYETVLRKIFGIGEQFGQETQNQLDKFYEQKDAILSGQSVNEKAFLKLAKKLADKSVRDENVLLKNIIIFELKQLNKITGKTYEI